MDHGLHSSPAHVVLSRPARGPLRLPSPAAVPTMTPSHDRGLRQNTVCPVPEHVLQDVTATIILRIQDVIEEIVDALKENRPLSIPLRSRRTGNEIAVLFPTASKSGAKRFAAILEVLYHCHEALVSGTIITKRHIYYQNPELFGSQSYVDQIVDDLAFTFGVGRDELNIVAASKGLVSGGPFQGEPGNHGVAIPQVKTSEDINLHRIQWILIIEKEATFRSLTAAQYFDISAAGPGLLVTAKGYPDLATRHFLCWIHSQYPCIPLYALVDFDPDGISIMRTYKHGSRNLQHETNVTISGLVWLGIKSSDIFGQKPNQRSNLSPSSLTTSQSYSYQYSRGATQQPSTVLLEEIKTARLTVPDYKALPLSANNRIKAINILRTFEDSHALDIEEINLIHELQLMLILNVKFEIQAVDEGGNMKHWLNEKLCAVHD